MLDVHAPHETAHTWKDFFIHIATIVVGLIIAIGLEQAVEHIHEHYQLHAFREAPHHEREANRHDLAIDIQDWQITTAELRNNLAVLDYIRQHPRTRQDSVADSLQWDQYAFRSEHAIWNAAQANGIVRLMPIDEANQDLNFYQLLSGINQQSLDTWNADNDASRFDLVDHDAAHLSPQQLDQVIDLTVIALEKHLQQGYSMALLAGRYHDMPQTISFDMLAAIRATPLTLDPQKIFASRQHTKALLNAIEKDPNP